MLQNIDSRFKETVAIVAVGYNRLNSMKRLLNSLLQANYPSEDIPLVISIDCSGETMLYDYVKDFKWPFGQKYVNIQEERLGLKNHIYQCGDLTEFFKGVIVLEDDLYVGPSFYYYAIKALEKYGEDKRIAQISLYKNERNGYVGFPFVNMQNGCDVFLYQGVSTWGECWNKSMWSNFKKWRDTHSEEDIQNIDLPDAVKKWTRAWSKYYNAYIVDQDKFVIYPNIPVTTNFSDAGEHGDDNNSLVQVNLLQEDFEYRLYDYERLYKYDIFANNLSVCEWLGIDKKDICLDFYGFHNNTKGCKFMLSTRILPYKIIKSFALNMRPIELNVKYNIEGNGIYLYETFGETLVKKGKYTNDLIEYFLEGFNHKYLIIATIEYYWNRIKAMMK